MQQFFSLPHHTAQQQKEQQEGTEATLFPQAQTAAEGRGHPVTEDQDFPVGFSTDARQPQHQHHNKVKKEK